MSNWISVKDKLPAKGDDVLVAFTNTSPSYSGRYIDTAAYYNEYWHWGDDYDRVNEDVIEITHWQSLPALPENEELLEETYMDDVGGHTFPL